jgi:hypothetical protein
VRQSASVRLVLLLNHSKTNVEWLCSRGSGLQPGIDPPCVTLLLLTA